MKPEYINAIRGVAEAIRPDLPQHSATLDWALEQLAIERADLQRRLDNATYLLRGAIIREYMG